MNEIHKVIINKELNARMLLQVHDELIFEVKDNEVESSIDIIKNIMEKNHLKYKDFVVPLIVDYGVGNNWGESH